MSYISRKQLEYLGEPVGDPFGRQPGDNQGSYHGGGKGGADAPDFTALAEAGEKAAELGYELGQDQLAENQRQYNQNYALQAPISQAQAGLVNQQIQQGDDYFNYMQQYSRPADMMLFYSVLGLTPDEISQVNTARQTAIQTGDAAAQSTYQQQMDQYNQQVAAAKQSAYFIDSNGKTIQADQVSEVLKPTSTGGIIGYTTAPSQGGAFANLLKPTIQPVYADEAAAYGGTRYGSGSFIYNSLNKTGKQTEEQKKAAELQQQGYFQIKTKDGSTVWVKSGAPNANPTADSIQKPLEQNAQYDFTDANNLTTQLGLAAQQRLKEREALERGEIEGLSNTLASRIGETNAQVYGRYRDDIEAEAGQAVADSRAGYTNALNVAARQGLRYGFSPSKLAALVGQQGVMQAAQQASAANQTRNQAVNTMYGRGVGEAGQQLTGAQQSRAMKTQDDNLQFAKQLDLAGIYRGLPGASQGAYNTAISAGNAAVGNQLGVSGQYLQGMNAGTGTIMQGSQQNVNALGNIAQMQTGMYNQSQGSGDAIWGALGTAAGGYLGTLSDENVKKNVKKVSDAAALDGIKKTRVKRWQYDESKVQDGEIVDDKEHIGAMAQDMQKNLGDQVSNGRTVDLISAIGVNMAATKALAKEVDKLKEKNHG